MDLLSNILSHLRLKGTLYFRTSFTSPWGVRVPAYADVARFHFAHKGRCFVRIEKHADPILLAQGDLVIIMRGAAHTLYCDHETEEQALPLDRVVEESGFDGHGTLVYGEVGTDQETQLICGHFAFDPSASHPVIDALPASIHIRSYGDAAGNWMENTLKVIGSEAGRSELGSNLIAQKLSEIIFAQALRSYLNSHGTQEPVLAGLSDTNLSRALLAIHRDPAHGWSLEELARIAGMSRTTFITKFSTSVAMTPLSYITFWRMQVARRMLAETASPVIDVAVGVGYQSEAAFGRVFRKQFDIAPATFRREVQQSAMA